MFLRFARGVEYMARLASVRKQEKWMRDLYLAIQKRLTTALAPLNDYLTKFKKYEDLIKLDVDQYVKRFSAEEHDIKEIRAEIQAHTRAKARIEQEVPRHVSLGMVVVNCEEVRRRLGTKYRSEYHCCLHSVPCDL